MRNIIVLLGNENFLINRESNLIKEKYKIDEFNEASYDCEELSIEDAINDCETMPFLGELKLVKIKNPYFLTGTKVKSKVIHDIDKFMDYINNPNESTILIIHANYPKLDIRKKITKALKNKAHFIDCNSKSFGELNSFIIKNFENKGYKINSNTSKELLNRCDSNMNLISQEMKKIILYKEEDKNITISDIKLLVSRNLENDVFQLTNALLINNKKQIITIYNDLLELKENPVTILSIIASQFQTILKTKLLMNENYNKTQIAKELRTSVNRVYYLMKNSNLYSFNKLKSIIIQLSSIDINIKTGKIDSNVALEVFLLRT